MASDLGGRIDAIADRSRARHVAEREARAIADKVHAEGLEKKRIELRESMPDVARVVDLFRGAGVEVKVLAACENGRSVVNRRGCERMGVVADEYEQG